MTDTALPIPDATVPAPEADAAPTLPAAPEPELERLPSTAAGTWDVMGAAWQAETIRTDAWDYTGRKRRALVTDMFEMLPPEAQRRVMDRQKAWKFGDAWAPLEQMVMDEAARERHRDPALWANTPATQDEFETYLEGARKTELTEAQAILDQPGHGLAEFAGAAARDMTDMFSLAMLPMGVSGGVARTLATEAVLGTVGNTITLPREYQAADDLDIAGPSALQRAIEGAALGAGLPAAVMAVAKVWSKARAYRAGLRDATPAGADGIRAEAAVNAAEANMRGDRTVQETMRDALPQPERPPAPGADGLSYNEDATLAAIIGAESGGVANAQSPTSNARGLGQFIPGTWMDMVERHRPDLMEGRTANEVLALRDDPAISAEMTRAYMRENHDRLAAQGLPAGPGEIYLAHFMGPGGAARALKSPLDTPITAIMSPKEIAANAGIRFNGKKFADFTAYDLRMWAQHKMRAAYDPASGATPADYSGYRTQRGYTETGQVTAGEGFRVDVRYEVVDATSLLRASGDLQPRDRTRAASDAWIARQAARLDPAQLMPAPTADKGSPIVGPDNVIESGNGRYGIIQRAYDLHPDRADAYRAQIEAAGFAIPEGIERPILVARRTSDLAPDERVKFAVAAQDSGVAEMTPTEVARVTSRAMTGPVLAKFDPSQPLTHEINAAFVRDVLEDLPSSAVNAMVDAKKLLNKSGERRLREALFARAWTDPDILARYTETDAGELKTLLDALEKAAPAWAALKADIEAGLVRQEMDISGHVMDAMRLIMNARDLARKDGLSIGDALTELLDEIDLLHGRVAPLTVALVKRFWRNGRAVASDEVAGFLTRYADEARKAGAAGGMFGGPGPRDVLVTIDKAAFADLPDDLGPVRGFAAPAARAEEIAATPTEGFDAGAAAPDAALADAQIVDSIRDAAPARRGKVGQTMRDLMTAAIGKVRPDAAARRTLDDLNAEFGNLDLDLPDGTRATVIEVLDDLDHDRRFEAFLQACAIEPKGAA